MPSDPIERIVYWMSCGFRQAGRIEAGTYCLLAITGASQYFITDIICEQLQPAQKVEGNFI